MDAVVRVPLSRGMFAIIDESDADRVLAYKWYASKSKSNWYARSDIYVPPRKKRILWMHRFILNVAGFVDHRNGDTLNNRRFNLRPATIQQNNYNAPKRPGFTSQFKGVSFGKASEKWLAAIKRQGKSIYLGSFVDEADAARAYDAAARQLFGEFARLNFPEAEAVA